MEKVLDIKVINLGKDKFIKFDQFLSYFHDETAAVEEIREIFKDEIYSFKTSQTQSLMIDLGCGLGISSLYLQRENPHAKIVCFEANSVLAALCEKNFKANNIKNVTLVLENAAENPAKVSSYINHPIDFLKIDLPEKAAQMLEGLGKKLLYVQELVCKCHSQQEAEHVQTVLAPHFSITVTQPTQAAFYILRAKKV